MAQPPENETEPSLASLIIRGILLIIGACVSAPIILMLHQPIGH